MSTIPLTPETTEFLTEATKVVEPKTLAEQAKFQFTFSLMMLRCDRMEMAIEAAGKCEALLDELIEKGH